MKEKGDLRFKKIHNFEIQLSKNFLQMVFCSDTVVVKKNTFYTGIDGITLDPDPN